MNIELGYNPTPSNNYFVSVGLNDKEWISFDNTTKGFRVMKQVLIDKRFKPLEEISGEWNDIILKDGKFIGRNHCIWYDYDKFDVVNGETWETVWTKPITKEVHKKILHYSRFIADHLDELNDKYTKELSEFEDFIAEVMEEYK